MDSKRESSKQTQAADNFFPALFFLTSPLPGSQFFYPGNHSNIGQRDHRLLHYDLQKEGNVHCSVNMLLPELYFHYGIKSRIIRIVFLLPWCSGREWFNWPITPFNESCSGALPASHSRPVATPHYQKVFLKVLRVLGHKKSN